MESLTLSNLDILFGREEQLWAILEGRLYRNTGLKELVVRSCLVHDDEYGGGLMDMVEDVWWEDMIVMGSDYEGTDEGSDSDELEEE